MDALQSTILLIDDHPMLRNGIKQLISSTTNFTVVGEASTGQVGITFAEQLEPDIILLDINLQDMSGLEVLHHLRAHNISSRIIMFTVSDDKQDIILAIKNGADGYLLKDMEPENFLQSLQEIIEGKIMMDDSIAQIILSYMRGEYFTTNMHDINLLTPREHEIFTLLVQGLANKLIAKQLSIVESTVKVHVKSILKKLNFKSRMEIAVWYFQNRD